MLRDIRVSCSPHISGPLSTRSVMIDVIIGLVPAMAAAGYYFRIHALILVPTCVICSVATEWLCNLIRKKPSSLDDFSAVVTGIILALSLPPSLPVWAAVLSGRRLSAVFFPSQSAKWFLADSAPTSSILLWSAEHF